MDERVKEAQIWLNQFYYGRRGYQLTTVNGKTGNSVMTALVTALQIELGMENPTGYFGELTANLYEKNRIKKGDEDTDKHLVRILQHGLYCKGYNPTAVTGYFGDNTLKAVNKVCNDAGLEACIGDEVSAKVLKQILSSDALVLVPGGDNKIRKIQQDINKKYSDKLGIISCDGKYNIQTNTAFIYAFQIICGMDKATANGNFGPMTQTLARDNKLSIGTSKQELVKLAKYGLYCNGIRRNGINVFDCSENTTDDSLNIDEIFTGIYDEQMKNIVEKFQKYVGILEVDGNVDIKVWMSLFVSTGYPKRNVLACDTSVKITEVKAKRIYVNDFRIIGRYLTGSTTNGPKNLTKEELNLLFNQGLSVFAIYQDEKEYYRNHPDEMTTVKYYNYEQGKNDAQKAVEAAESLGIPYGEPIFFAVDYDFNNDQTTKMIIPHFQGIYDYIRKNGNKYLVGCYAPRNICRRISDNGYATWSFVSDMSTGFSGNKGFILPENWVFDQIREYTQKSIDGDFALDCVASSGKYNGFNHIVEHNNEQIQIKSEDVAFKFYKDTVKALGYDFNIVEFDKTYTLELPDMKVSCQGSYGTSVSLGKNTRRSKFDIKDGKIESVSFDAAMQSLEAISTDNSLGIDYDGIVDMQNRISFNIDNGYIEMGLNISDIGEVSVSYLVHKEATAQEGLTKYVEVGLEIVFNDKLSTEEVKEYNTNKEKIIKYKNKEFAEVICDVVFSGMIIDLRILNEIKDKAFNVAVCTFISGLFILFFSALIKCLASGEVIW